MNLNDFRHSPALALCAGLIAALGAWLLLGGLWLAMLGGVWFYLLAGLAMVAAAGLMCAGRDSGVALYMATLACSAIWAATEVGADLPALWSRLWLPLLLGLWLVLIWWRRARP